MAEKSPLLPGFFASLKPAIPAIPIVQPVRLFSDQAFFLRTWTSVASLVIRIQFRLFSPELDEEYSTSVVIANGTTGDRASEFWPYDFSPIFRHLFKSRAAERPLYLLDFQCYLDSGTASRGACFVQAGIHQRVGSSPFIHTLFADYLTTRNALAWPGSPIRHSLEGPGLLRHIAVADPAAGAEFSETVPTNARWRLIAVGATLITDGTAATRDGRLSVDDGVNTVWFGPPGASQAASLTRIYHWASGMAPGSVVGGNGYIWSFLPAMPLLLGGWRIRSSTVNLQLADNWNTPLIWAEEWIED